MSKKESVSGIFNRAKFENDKAVKSELLLTLIKEIGAALDDAASPEARVLLDCAEDIVKEVETTQIEGINAEEVRKNFSELRRRVVFVNVAKYYLDTLGKKFPVTYNDQDFRELEHICEVLSVTDREGLSPYWDWLYGIAFRGVDQMSMEKLKTGRLLYKFLSTKIKEGV